MDTRCRSRKIRMIGENVMVGAAWGMNWFPVAAEDLVKVVVNRAFGEEWKTKKARTWMHVHGLSFFGDWLMSFLVPVSIVHRACLCRKKGKKGFWSFLLVGSEGVG